MSVKPLNSQVYFSGGPVDGRTIVATEANITGISNAYVGMEVTVLNDGSPVKYIIKKLTVLGKPDTKANGGYEELIETIGAASKTEVNTLSEKIDKLPTGIYYGQYDSEEDLEDVQVTTKGYAYISSTDPAVYYIYLYDGNSWTNSGNKFVTTNLETDLSTKSEKKAPTTKVVAEGIEAIDVTTEQEFTSTQKETARTNINAQENIASMADKLPVVAALNNRAADINQQTSEVKALGYKVLNPTASFASQVVGVDKANMIFEIRDEFDLNNTSVTIPANCTLKFNGGKIKNGTIVGNGTVIDASRTTIFDSNVIFSGTFVGEAYPEWVGNNINKCVNAFKCVKLAPNKTYQVTETIVMPWKSSIVGEKTTILNTSISPVIDMGYLTTLDNFIIKTNHTDNVINISTDNITKTYYSRELQSARQININNIVITSTVQQWSKVTSIPSSPTAGQIIKINTNELAGFEENHYYRYSNSSWNDITDVLSQYGIYEESSCIQILCDGWCPSRPNNLGLNGMADISIDNVNINGRWKYGVRIDNGTHAGINITYLWITDIRIRKLWCYYVLNTFYITRDDKGGTGTHYPEKIYISNCSTQYDNAMEYFVLGEIGSCVLEDCIPWDWIGEKYSIRQGAFYMRINNSEDFSSSFPQAIKHTGTSVSTPGFNYNMPEGAAIGNRIYGSITSYTLGDVPSGEVAKVKNIKRLPYGIIKLNIAYKESVNLKLYSKIELLQSNAYVYLFKFALYGEIGLILIAHGEQNDTIAFNIIPSAMSNEDEIPDWIVTPKLNQFVSKPSSLVAPAFFPNAEYHGGRVKLDKSTNKLYSYNNTTQKWYDSTGVEVAGMEAWKDISLNLKPLTQNKGVGARFYLTDKKKWLTWDGTVWNYDDGSLPDDIIQVDQAVVNFSSPAADTTGKVVTVYMADGVVGSVVSQYYSAFPTTVEASNQIRIKTSANSSAGTAGSEIYIIKDEVVTQGDNFPTTNLSDGRKFFKTHTSIIGGVEYPRFHFYEYSVESANWSDITSTFASNASKVKKIMAYKPGSVMTISPSSHEFPAEGGSQEFTATTYANSLSEVTIVPVDADWITMGTIANKKITLTAAENTGAARQVSVTFKDSAPKTTTIVITQKAGVATVEE